MGTNIVISSEGSASFIYNSILSKWLTTSIMTSNILNAWSKTGNSGTTAGSNGIQMNDIGNCNLEGNKALENGDTLTLIWDNAVWYQLAMSNN